MAPILFLLFLAVPLIEIGIFVQVGGAIGLWPTLGLVILTAIAGSYLLRAQGLAALGRVQREIDQGQMPTEALFDGVCLLFAGALLLTPGFLTDALGMLLFVPPVRDWLRRRLAARIQVVERRHGSAGGPRGMGPGGMGPGGMGAGARGPGGRGPIIDGEWSEVGGEEAPPSPNAGTPSGQNELPPR